MAFVRIYTGTDNNSHFENLDLSFQPGEPSTSGFVNENADTVVFRRQPAGLVQDWHTAPRRQYVITLVGMAELEVAGGEKRKFGPSDVLLAEDLTGSGHVTKIIGEQPRISVVIPIED